MYLTNRSQRATMRYGFSEWDEWSPVMPDGRFLACANYAGLDAPEWMPAGSCVNRADHVSPSVVMRPAWWG